MTANRAAMLMLGFTPLQFANCVLWLDASDTSTVSASVGNPVATWLDKLGAGYTQATGTKQPIYTAAAQNGRNAILFDGTDDRLSCGTGQYLRVVSGWTMFAAAKTLSTSNQRLFTVISDPATFNARACIAVYKPAATGHWSMFGLRNNNDTFVDVTDTNNVDTSNWAQISTFGNYTATTGTLRVNGTQVATNTSWMTSGNTPNDNGSGSVSSDPSGTLTFFNGYVGEVILYSTVLTAAQILVVEAYLKGKWATP